MSQEGSFMSSTCIILDWSLFLYTTTDGFIGQNECLSCYFGFDYLFAVVLSKDAFLPIQKVRVRLWELLPTLPSATEALRHRKAQGMKLGRPTGTGKSKLDQYRVEIEALLSNVSSQGFIAKRYGTTEANFSNWMKKNNITKMNS